MELIWSYTSIEKWLFAFRFLIDRELCRAGSWQGIGTRGEGEMPCFFRGIALLLYRYSLKST